MRVGIMQPYFFPYFEHFRLIAACDKWVVFDTVKYNRRSWMNRNRIINREKGWSYVKVPVSKGDDRTLVKDARVATERDWRRDFFKNLRVYEHRAPNYDRIITLLRQILDTQHTTLAGLNTHILREVCRFLGIDVEVRQLSEMSLSLPESCAPGEWALFISKALGATEYRNPSGGRDIFDAARYEQEGIVLSFHSHIDLTYDTGPFRFEPDLSIIDPLMWMNTAELQRLVRS